MTDFWRGGIPRDLGLSSEAIVEVRRTARRRLFASPAAVARFLLLCSVPPLLYSLFISLVMWPGRGIFEIDPSRPLHFLSILALWYVGLMACLYAGAVVAHRRVVRPVILKVMRDMGHDVCAGCGYLLRGLDDDVKRCPECGIEREPAAIAVL